MVDVIDMVCCGIRELDQLSQLELTPAGARATIREIKSQLTTKGHYEERYDWDAGRMITGPWIEESFKCPAFFVYSQAGTPTDITGRGAYGDYFTSFVIEQGLGTVQESEPALNENSSNLLKVFLWTVNQEAFKAWGKKVPKKKEAA